MQKGYRNKYNTYVGIKALLVKKRGAYSTIPIIVELVREFHEKIDEIARVSARAVYGTKQYTITKQEIKTSMAKKASALAAAGMVYGIEKDDPEITGALNWSYTGIRFATDTEALFRSGLVKTTLRKYLPELKGYPISEKDIAELEDAINKYEMIIQVRGKEKVENITANARLKMLFKETDDLLYNKLDRLMLRIGEDKPDFYDHYKEARKIYDYK